MALDDLERHGKDMMRFWRQ